MLEKEIELYDEERDLIFRKKEDGTLSIVGTRESQREYIIPMEYEGVSVTSIDDWVFDECNDLLSIIIPDSVISVGFLAFNRCSNLKNILVSDGNKFYSTIGGVLFDKKAETIICYPAGKTESEYTIPESVTSIDNSAFYDCNSLTSIVIPDSVSSIGDFAFSGCSNLTSIVIPNSVTSIGDNAFDYCSSLTTIVIPNSVTSIGDYSFGECSSLTTIDIPSSVTSLGYYAFSGCNNLTEIIINRKHDGTLSDAPWGGDEDSFGRKKTIKVIWLDETVLYE